MDHQAQAPGVEEDMGAAEALAPSSVQTRTPKTRLLKAVITNLLFAQPRAAILAALGLL
ncbi:MAG TPA: hypothetical protein VJY33_01910 [Isosphaeraceae bacterium]|nr:hypothetical protein [Isosphaeraceae bacterium]